MAFPDGHWSGDAAVLVPAEARPASRRADLLGRQPVRVRAEGDLLIAYGFGRQRVALIADSIGEVAVRTYRGDTSYPLLVLGRDQRVLLRAAGTWDLGEVGRVCDALGLPPPVRLTETDPRPRRAPGYRRLRTRPHGTAAAALVTFCVRCSLAVLGLLAGPALWAALPAATGSVRILIALAGAAGGVAAAWWLCGAAGRALLAALRWCAVSLAARGPAPAWPYSRREERTDHRWALSTIAMVIAVPALIAWGPVIGTLTLVHGLDDQQVISLLRHHGTPATGHVVSIPAGYTQVCPDQGSCQSIMTYGTGLQFTTRDGRSVLVPALNIAGRQPPIQPAAVTIIYDPAHPATAAVAGQLPRGSVWAGAAAGNLISGALLTAALPLLVWRLIPRLRLVRRHMQRLEELYGPASAEV